MQRHEESLYPGDWLRIAARDLTRVENLLMLYDAEGAAFYLQQAVEKFLKAFLLSKGWALQRIHDLEALLNVALRYDSSLERFRNSCREITMYYIVDRYPSVTDFGLTEEKVLASLNNVRELVELLRAQTPDNGG